MFIFRLAKIFPLRVQNILLLATAILMFLHVHAYMLEISQNMP